MCGSNHWSPLRTPKNQLNNNNSNNRNNTLRTNIKSLVSLFQISYTCVGDAEAGFEVE